MEKLIYNSNVRLIISDVDETLAHTYTPASDLIIQGLNNLLAKGTSIFFISGQSLNNICNRIIDRIDKSLRSRILVGACSGAEVWGFDNDGNPLAEPFYSKYNELFNEDMKKHWREIVAHVIDVFGLKTTPTMSKPKFQELYHGDVETIMYEDRNSQITFEVVNSCALSEEDYAMFCARVPFMEESRDLRDTIIKYANGLFEKDGLPISARKAGNFAIDFAVCGVTKTTAVRFGIFSEKCKKHTGNIFEEAKLAEEIEIWGDKFSVTNGGTDRHICEALPMNVRAMDFRKESQAELPEGYNICIWDGENRLCEAVEEYMIRSEIV